MATTEEAPVQILERTMRKTRGKRMAVLVDDELETDEQFWGQEVFKEEENDYEYEQEGETVDEFDSDFDDDEPVADEEPAEAEERTVKKKKFLLGTGKDVKKKSKKKVLSSLEISPETAEDSAQESKPAHSKDQETAIDLEVEKTVRKSTRTAVIVRQAEREAIQAALQASIRPVKRKREGEDRRMTQEEMLLEAAQTEIMNIRHLEKMLAREEEVKKKANTNKSVYSGPLIRFYSKDGKNTLEFTNVSTFPSAVFSKSAPYPEQSVCVITGQPAKYLDPKTGMPYATKEAFKIIRERFSEITKQSGDHIFEKGSLATSILGQGFSRKGRRSSVGRFRSPATPRKRAESELQSGELVLPSSVDINDASPAISDIKEDLHLNATRDPSSLPSSSTLLQPAREFNGHDIGESDPKTCTKEKYTVTPPAGSVPTLSLGSPLSGPEIRQASMFEDLDLGLRLGTGSKVPKGLIFKDPKP